MSSREWHVMSVPTTDTFEGMVPLALYLSPAAQGDYDCPQSFWYDVQQIEDRLNWAKSAMNVLEEAADEVGWQGDFRHTPYVGALPWSNPFDEVPRYLLVKQNNNGTCFIVSAFPLPSPPDQRVFSTAVVRLRQLSC
ncbi:hypothetical protein ACWLMY_35780 [Streptomyces anulatus]